MKRAAGVFMSAFLLFVSASCSKKDDTPANTTPSVIYYTVAFSLYSSQPKFLFLYTDKYGAHTDTINSQSDSIVTEVPSGADMQVLQKMQCIYTGEPDTLIIHAYMNGGSVSNSGYKGGSGNLSVGVELQSLL
jgi:hypothetical protein